jgi:hypothetical protein
MKKQAKTPKVPQSKLGKFEARKLKIASDIKAGTGFSAALADSDYTITSTGYTAGDDSDFHFES